MPEPVKRNQRYMPGLDGLRAIAVLAVIVFHLGFGWAPGGLLGVGIFFTLSGYLITDILLSQLSQRGKIDFLRFWGARARRLLPALFLMLAIVTAWVTIFGPAQPDQFRKAVLSSVFYVNNWEQIFANVSYFARFAPEGPLNHLWSLSVEEQFYIFWPFLLLLGVKLVHERPLSSGVRPRLALLAIVFASSPRSRWPSSTTRASTPRGSITAPTPAPPASSSALPWRWSGRAAASAAASPRRRATPLTASASSAC